MAPSAVETIVATGPPHVNPTVKLGGIGPYKELSPIGYEKEVEEKGKDDSKPAKVPLAHCLTSDATQYPHYLPTWNPEQKYVPLKPFKHVEHGLDADSKFPAIIREGVTITDLTPTTGTEVIGLQLSSLDAAGKDQLARLVAERKVVAFRDQDFADLPISKALEFGGYFGRHHIHPTSGSPEGYPEIHLVHRSAGDKTIDKFFENRTSSVAWHSDVSYEEQPPGTTFLYILDRPETGGDTIFVNQAEAYNRLSLAFQQRLHGLKALHSGVEQVEASKARGSIVRREPVINEHPIVRTHPVTKEKALYVNKQFTRQIVGFKTEESDNLLDFLYDHSAYGADFQVRIKWAERTVVVWDNRVTLHSALIDWSSGQRRHLARITPQAERPFETPFDA